MRALRIAAAVEALSLAALLVNLVTVHVQAVSSLLGPLHGTAYLAIIVLTLTGPAAAAPGARWRSAVPGVGGLLVLRRVTARQPS
ncbi:DUF3817 domain-containing protein [Actinomadura rubrisoli]|uniref:DUF3817 domain-containing protein n=1 Tax=Actinomadura rubrisoli TaxID=2530368 RepID=A0A4V2YVD8_9ACTN|nr:DUF3817 domain-containing protein [Actinomadura rubrisoli]TDD81127.1 DUF3817 domain-containing protein [Actinomadura rubrisoli]